MALNTCEIWFNGIKIAFLFLKIAQRLGASPPDPQSLRRLGTPPPTPPLRYFWVTQAFSTRLQSKIFTLFNYSFKCSFFAKSWLSANRQRFQILHPTISLSPKKFLIWKILMTSLQVICGLGPPPNQKFWLRLKIGPCLKNSFKEDLFFWEHLRLCPWPWSRAFLSLASRGSVFGKAVLGLGFFFFVLCLGFEPCVLDSTSGLQYWVIASK